MESGRSLRAGEFPWWCTTVKLNSVHYLISVIWIMPATWITLNCLNYFVNGPWTTTEETNRENAISFKASLNAIVHSPRIPTSRKDLSSWRCSSISCALTATNVVDPLTFTSVCDNNFNVGLWIFMQFKDTRM